MAETIFTPPGIEVHRKIADYLRLDKGCVDHNGFTIESTEKGQHLLHWRSIRSLTKQEMTDIMKIIEESGSDLG